MIVILFLIISFILYISSLIKKQDSKPYSSSNVIITETKPNDPLTVIVPEFELENTINYTTYSNLGDPISTGFLKTGSNTITGTYLYILFNIYDSKNNIINTFNVNYPNSSSKSLDINNNIVTIPYTTVTINNDTPLIKI